MVLKKKNMYFVKSSFSVTRSMPNNHVNIQIGNMMAVARTLSLVEEGRDTLASLNAAVLKLTLGIAYTQRHRMLPLRKTSPF